MNDSNRIDYIDTAKGIGIFFVVIGHHLLGADILRGWINSFHMPLFFIITGFLLSYKEESYKNVKQMILNKAIRILYPYFTFGVLILSWYIMYYLILPFGIKPDEEPICVFIKTITTYGYHALWFLPTLFFATILFLIINKRKSKNILFITLIILGIVLGIMLNNPIIKEKSCWYIFNYFSRIIIATGFIYIGFIFQHVSTNYKKSKEWIIIIIAFLVSVCFFYFNIGNANLALSKMGNPFLYYILAIAGSVFIMLLCKQMDLHKGVINFWGRNSLIIMAIHMDFPVEIAWMIVGSSGLSIKLPQIAAASIVIIIELIIESICAIFINRYFRFMFTLVWRNK